MSKRTRGILFAPQASGPVGDALTRIIGEVLICKSHPDGMLAGMAERANELTRARRWKSLARKLRAELKQAGLR
jgi:hypothetical protein